jgi:hypothetical protein
MNFNMTLKKLPFLFILGAIIFLSACSHSKKAAKSKEPAPATVQPAGVPVTPARIQGVLNAIHANELPFSELLGKMKTKATWDGRTQSFVTQMRWKKGEKIWMSMSVIGIEGARTLMNKDSVKITDRLGQRHILKPISYIKQKTFVDLSFSDIEKIFLGQLFLVDTTKMELSETSNQLILKSAGTRFVSTVILDKSHHIQHINITDIQYKQTIQADFSNYQAVGQKSFPMDRYLKIVSGSYIFELDAKFQSVDITKKLSYPFELNPNYKIE